MKTYEYRFKTYDEGDISSAICEGSTRELGDFADEATVERLFDQAVTGRSTASWSIHGRGRDREVKFEDGSTLDDWGTVKITVHRQWFDEMAFANPHGYDVTLAIPASARYMDEDR